MGSERSVASKVGRGSTFVFERSGKEVGVLKGFWSKNGVREREGKRERKREEGNDIAGQ